MKEENPLSRGRLTHFFLGLVFLSLYFQLPAQTNKPNIIVILADDMGYSDLGCMGSEIKTPTLDSLANQGLLFTNFYNTSRCTPSRGSLLTGLSGHQAGVGLLNGDNEYSSYQGFLSRNAVTIAEVLQPTGYRTIQVGKWHLGDARENWPDKRGFERTYSIPTGGGVYFWPAHNSAGNRPLYLNGEIQDPRPDWYSTDDFTDYAIQFTEESHQDEKPFFMYLAYIAPHFPLQARPEDIAKYRNKYAGGYAEIQNARFQRQKELGIVADSTVLPSPDFPNWNNVSNKDHQDLKMAIYAAQMDNMDHNIGRLVQKLKDLGIYDNTIIFFLSDNGGASANRNVNPTQVGTANSFVSYGRNWANVSNTPFRKYKAQEHEGGIATPMIAHWPDGLNLSGQMIREAAHISDFMPTILEITKTSYPDTFNSNEIYPLMGESLVPLFNGQATSSERVFGWEHEGNRGLRKGKWKLVALRNQNWELYDMDVDPTELNNLASANPAKVVELIEEYEQWKVKAHVIDRPVNISKNYQFENFKILDYSGSTPPEVIQDIDAGGDQTVSINAIQNGEYVDFRLPVYVPGFYTISLTGKKGPDRGMFDLMFDGDTIRQGIDLYNSSEAFGTSILNQRFISNGMVNLRIAVSGKNNESSGYRIELDQINMRYSRSKTVLSNSEFEAMRMSENQISGGSFSIVGDDLASGNKFLKLTPRGVGEFITFTIDIDSSHLYDVKIRGKQYTSRGQFKIHIGNQQIGGIIDQYGTGNYVTESLGQMNLIQGPTTLKIEVTGRNTQSSGFGLSLDEFILEPVVDMPEMVNAPSMLKTTETAETSIKLTWQDNSDNETGFSLERKSESMEDYQVVAQLSSNVESYLDLDLSSGTSYSYRIKAFKGDLDSEYSNILTIQTLRVLPQPTNLTSKVELTSATLSWNTQGENQFILERKDTTEIFNVVDTIRNDSTYQDNSLERGTLYTYRLRALEGVRSSMYSDAVEVFTPEKLLAPIIMSDSVGSNMVQISWLDSGNQLKNIIGYIVERKENELGYVVLDSVQGSSHYLDQSLKAATNYFYKVAGYTALEKSPYSSELSLTTASILKVLRKNKGTQLVVYPHPVIDMLNLDIKLSKPSPIELHLRDLEGRNVRTWSTEMLPKGRRTISWNLKSDHSSLKTGVYFLELITADGTTSQKIILK